jgi:hypothetical protein
MLARRSSSFATRLQHLLTDPGTPDHNGVAAAPAWRRSLSFLAACERG